MKTSDDERDRSFRLGVGFSFDPWSFTNDGNFPQLCGWIETGRAIESYPRRRGFKLIFSLKPLKLGWNGKWVIR